jgi:hypothetical protein
MDNMALNRMLSRRFPRFDTKEVTSLVFRFDKGVFFYRRKE